MEHSQRTITQQSMQPLKVGSLDYDRLMQPAHPRSKQPIISVIIPHYNDLASLRKCLERLSQQTFASEQFEIVVADNNSAVGIDRIHAAAAHVATVIQVFEQGAAMARNAGANVARAGVLAFIDSDCLPAPDWLEKGYRGLTETKADVVGGQVQVVPENMTNPNPVEAFELIFAFKNKTYVETLGFSVTANLFVTQDVFRQVGDFQRGVSEDKDWGLRAGEMGFEWSYQDEVVVDHPARSDWLQLAKKWQRLTQEEYLLRQSHNKGKLSWLLYSLLILLSPFLHVSKILMFKGLSPTTKIGAIAILFRIRFYRFNQAIKLLFNKENAL